MLAYELKPEKGTICYVPAKYYEAYINKFGNINVTFRITPISIEQTVALGSDIQPIDLNESVSNAEGVVFSVTEGSELPAGITIENGVISGTPEALGDFTTTFDISKNDTVIGTADVKIHVEGAFCVEITGTYNEELEEELKNFVSGDEDVTFALAEGSELPADLTLENGSITGVPEAAGEFTTTLDLYKNGSSVGTLDLIFKIDKAMPEITVNLTNTSITIGDVLTEEDFEVVCDIPGSITWENSGQPLTEGENVIVWNFVPEDENYAETTGTIVLNIAAPEGNNDPSALTLIDIQYIFAYDLGFFNYEHTYSFTVEVTPGSDNGNGQISTNYSNNTSVNGNNCSQNGSITSIIPNCVNHLHSTISRLFSIFH